VILREATRADADVIESLDLGVRSSPSLDEVREILSGLTRWQADVEHRPLDRRVVVAEIDDRIVGVAAHELAIDERTAMPFPGYRYLLVVAIDAAHQRSGFARFLTESLFVDMASDGITSVSWLVAPDNHESLAFTRNVFPEAEETQAPEDRPYLRFTLRL
jgi:ribosomal protein S18 acetylase RimI-like enzyme